MKQLTFNWADLFPRHWTPDPLAIATDPQQRDYHFYQPFSTI